MRCCIGIGLTLSVLMAAPLASPAQADVIEVGGSGFVWKAGGPVAGPSASQAVLTPRPQAPVTEVSVSAGPVHWAPRVAELAARYDISPSLIEALVWQESRWRTNAVSPAGARGLAQLMPGTARQLGVDPDDPAANLEGGARYLRMQLDTFGGDLEKALAAYNAGPGRVTRAGGIPAIRETRDYVAAILSRLSPPDMPAKPSMSVRR